MAFHLASRQVFKPSCPSGGDWFSCGYGTKFVGCCDGTTNPCQSECKKVKPASFDAAYYGTSDLPDQSCPTGAKWYTCGATSVPFMGCCKSNPCTKGCPEGDLVGGILSSNTQNAAKFSPSPSPSSKTTSTASHPTSTATTSSSTSSPTSSPTSTSTTPPSATPSDASASGTSSTKLAAIIGGSVGIVAFITIIALVSWLYLRRRRNRRQSNEFNTGLLSKPYEPITPSGPIMTDTSYKGYTGVATTAPSLPLVASNRTSVSSDYGTQPPTPRNIKRFSENSAYLGAPDTALSAASISPSSSAFMSGPPLQVIAELSADESAIPSPKIQTNVAQPTRAELYASPVEIGSSQSPSQGNTHSLYEADLVPAPLAPASAARSPPVVYQPYRAPRS